MWSCVKAVGHGFCLKKIAKLKAKGSRDTLAAVEGKMCGQAKGRTGGLFRKISSI